MTLIADNVLVFGAGAFGRDVARALQRRGCNVRALISARPADGELDWPVLSWGEVAVMPNAPKQILVGIFNRSDAYSDLDRICRENGFVDVLMPWQYYPLLESDLGWRYWLQGDSGADCSAGLSPECHELLAMLSDQESREIVRRIVDFRLGLDLDYSRYQSPERQYFNRLSLSSFEPGCSLRYLDVGAFDGGSLRALASLFPVEMAYLFEPHPANFEILRSSVASSSLSPVDRVILFPFALASRQGIVALRGDGEAATVREVDSGEFAQVAAVPGDDIFALETIDLVKIDAEGSDADVLAGMSCLLRRSKPVVCVSLYHRPMDLWEIPVQLRGILGDSDYRFYIRQHGCNSFDAVFYAVPVLAR